MLCRKLNLKLASAQALSELYELAHGIHTVFEKHKVVYFLDFGSAVGAMRHGGVIPWDDDLDIVLKEDNEALFLGNVRHELLNDKMIKIIKGRTDGIWDYKLISISNSSKVYPACDVFIVRLDKLKHKYVFRNSNLGATWPHEFNESLLHPTFTDFGDFQMRILPSSAYHYFDDWYGKSWGNVAMTSRYDHTADQHLIPMAFQIPRWMKISAGQKKNSEKSKKQNERY